METGLKRQWVPEICYEDSDEGMSGNLPFVQVPIGHEMPGIIFIFESRDTGQTEPGPAGEDLPIFEMELYQYANMSYLKEKLNSIEYDNVRSALGLEPLLSASEKGKKITQKVFSNINQLRKE